jgi:UDP-glucose 4-epimerase
VRIAITGATGNIGSALVRRLAAEGRHDLVGIARRVPADDEGTVEWHPVDLTRDEDVPALRDAVRGAEAVVHLAWGFQPSHRLDHLEELGVGGTRRVLEAVSSAGVGHVVHMSSVGAYSPKRDDQPVTEAYPTDGVRSSPYSRHKVAAERLLDRLETTQEAVVVSRMRPGIVGQRRAGSALLRYGVPVLVPAPLVRAVPVLPLDRAMVISMVHADDVADAVVRCLEGRVPGAFNLAAGAVTVDDIAAALGARHVQAPTPVLRAAASLAWHARLQQVDPGWIDLARNAPVLDAGRARRELGWSPTATAREVLEEIVGGMAGGDSGRTPVLRARSVPRELAALLRRGPVRRRREP